MSKHVKELYFWIVAIAVLFLLLRLIDWTGFDQRISDFVGEIGMAEPGFGTAGNQYQAFSYRHTAYLCASLIIAGILGGAVGLRKPFIDANKSILQAHILLSVSAATMMIIVGSELARAFGLMGAASIVRYRYALQSPKEGSSLVVALGIGIACGTNLYVLAIMVTLIVLFVGMVLKRIPGQLPEHTVREVGLHRYRLNLRTEDAALAMDQIKELMTSQDIYYSIKSIKRSIKPEMDGITQIVLICHLKDEEQISELTRYLIENNLTQVSWKFLGFTDKVVTTK